MQFAAVQRMPMQNRVGLATNLQRIVSHPQFRMYADTAVAKATGPKPEGLLKMDEVKSLSELKFNYPDASLSDAALEAKVFNRLKELEAQVCLPPPLQPSPCQAPHCPIFATPSLTAHLAPYPNAAPLMALYFTTTSSCSHAPQAPTHTT